MRQLTVANVRFGSIASFRAQVRTSASAPQATGLLRWCNPRSPLRSSWSWSTAGIVKQGNKLTIIDMSKPDTQG